MTSEVIEWLALHRVYEGGMSRLSGSYLNFGRPIAGYLADALDELVHAERLALGPPSPIGQQQVCVTHTGQARYAELSTANRSSQHRSGAR